MQNEIRNVLNGKKIQNTKTHNRTKALVDKNVFFSIQKNIIKELETSVSTFVSILKKTFRSLSYFIEKGRELEGRVILLSNVFMYVEKEDFCVLKCFKKIFTSNVFQQTEIKRSLINSFKASIQSIERRDSTPVKFSSFVQRIDILSYQEIVENSFFERIEKHFLIFKKGKCLDFLKKMFLIRKKEKDIAKQVLQHKTCRKYVKEMEKTLFGDENYKEVFFHIEILIERPSIFKKVVFLSKRCNLFSSFLSALSDCLSRKMERIIENEDVIEKTLYFKFKFESKFEEFSFLLKEILETSINKKKEFFSTKLALYWANSDKSDLSIERIETLFKYLRGKDVFREEHTRLLEERILQSLNLDFEREICFLKRLEKECGSQYTFVCNEILKDVSLSQDLFNEYKNNYKKESVFCPLVVSSAWPIEKKGSSVQRMKEFSTETFTKFYNKKHPKRKLNWQESVGSVIISAQFKQKRIDLLLKPIQSCILLLFSDDKSLTKEEIESFVSDCSIELQTLVDSNILFQKNNLFSFNYSFYSTKNRIDLLSIKEKIAGNNIRKDCLKEKKYFIESFIVRKTKQSGVIDVSTILYLLKKEFDENEESAMSFLQGLCIKGYICLKNNQVKYIP